MTIGFISDTHNRHRDLDIPELDILCISGDYTNIGSAAEYTDFYNWLEEQTQVRHKVFIEGNHDLMADSTPDIRRFYRTELHSHWIADLEVREESFKKHNIYRLCNSGISIEGIKFWGTPCTLAFYNWAFNMTAEQLKELWKEMPNNTDILLSHGPPLEKLDLCPNGHRAGDPWLVQKLLESKPLIHSFGHIHEQNPNTMEIGVEGERKTLLINSAVVNDDYSMNLRKPIVINVERAFYIQEII